MANLKTPTPSSHVSTWVDKETFFNEEIVYQNLAEQDPMMEIVKKQTESLLCLWMNLVRSTEVIFFSSIHF